MKLYLSSYQLEDHPEELVKLFGENKRIAVISNALEFSSDIERLSRGQNEQLENLGSIGLLPEIIDLRNYFGKSEELKELINNFGGVWVRGGNTFVLVVAYRKSGFDEIIKTHLVSRNDFVYSGFSAGCCVLQESLKGVDFVDDSNKVKEAYEAESEIFWDGVGILNYVFVPHFDSEHPESEDTNEEISYYKENNIRYKTPKDGQVIIDQII